MQIVLAASALPALAGAAAAQQPTQAQASAIRQACRADYESHCASVPTGGAAALQCLQRNAADLPMPCQKALSALGGNGAAASAPPPGASHPPPAPMSRREKAALLRADCGADYRAFCSGVEPGGGRAMACLHAHEPQLSPRCRSVLLSVRQAP